MDREDKLNILINKGYKYIKETGDIIGPRSVIKTKNGSKYNDYIQIRFYYNGKYYNILGHQFAWYYIYRECVDCIDHINQIKSDNRICNLRSVTKQQNSYNKKTKGYSYSNKRGKYIAQIALDGKVKNLGGFNTPEEARQTYLDAKKIYHII